MSEKRQRQQQQRACRRARSTGSRCPSHRGSAASAQSDRELATLLYEIAALGAAEPDDALDAEQWASGLVGALRRGPLPRVAGGMLPDFVAALATLRALAAVGIGEAEQAAGRLAATGLSEPSWVADLGRAGPVAAALMDEEVFDDGVSVFVELDAPSAGRHTLGV